MRRKVLLFALLGLSAGIALPLAQTGLAPGRESRWNQPGPVRTWEYAPLPSEPQFALELGPEEAVFPGILLGSFPDTHIAMLRRNNQVWLWMSAEVRTYLFRGRSLNTLRPHRLDSQGRPVPVLTPTASGTFDEQYAAFGSVFEAPTGEGLVGIYHAETCGRDVYTATIGLAVSRDGGISWTDRRPIVTGRTADPSCSKARPSGAGQPAAIRLQDWVYVYYTDWSAGAPDQIYLARAPATRITEPAAWHKYADGGFTQPGLGGDSTPVITPPPGGVYAASVGVSWNRALGRYIATFEASNGFYLTTSADGIAWEAPRQILAFAKAHDERTCEDTYYAYPTLLSDTASDTVTEATGYLYFARGVLCRENGGHRLFRMPFALIVPGTHVQPRILR